MDIGTDTNQEWDDGTIHTNIRSHTCHLYRKKITQI